MIYLTLQSLFEEARERSELKSRTMPGELDDVAIITESDYDTLRLFLKDGVMDLANRLGAIGKLLNQGDTVIHRLSDEQKKQGWSGAKDLLKKAIVNYLLFEWYRNVGVGELAQEFHALYEQAATDYRTNSTNPNFIKPNYRPYF